VFVTSANGGDSVSLWFLCLSVCLSVSRIAENVMGEVFMKFGEYGEYGSRLLKSKEMVNILK